MNTNNSPLRAITNSTAHFMKDTAWYAIYTRSRFEKKLDQALRKLGFETFLPLIKEKRVWSDRIKTVVVPLLPSYVFINTAKTQFPLIYTFPGFVRFVCFEGKPCVIKATEIALLKDITTHGFKAQTTTSCNVGDQVRIVSGPLKGWEGKIDSKRGDSRVVFHFEGIGQAISVEVGVGDVERVEGC